MPFPHPCGEHLRQAVASGADPATVVPDDFVVVRGGTKPLPPAATPFSAAVGPSVADAGCALPHGQLRVTTAGAVRAAGGEVVWVPEYSPRGTMNLQHVHVTEGPASTFSELTVNPVGRKDRIDEGK